MSVKTANILGTNYTLCERFLEENIEKCENFKLLFDDLYEKLTNIVFETHGLSIKSPSRNFAKKYFTENLEEFNLKYEIGWIGYKLI